jgi:hypothetical protein
MSVIQPLDSGERPRARSGLPTFVLATACAVGLAIFVQGFIGDRSAGSATERVPAAAGERAGPTGRRAEAAAVASLPRTARAERRFIVEPPAPPAEMPAAPPLIETHRMMDRQIERMREYAARHGADDPFSLTEEEIEAFRRQGHPVVW